MSFLFTSESVTEGHPDKICDQVSDAVLDAYLQVDPRSHVACECIATRQFLLIMGEISSSATVDIEAVARDVIAEIGYTDSALGFDAKTLDVVLKVGKQSLDIAQGVNRTDPKEQGAGDQGIMFGFATNETPEFMPLPISLAHRLAKRLADLRKKELLSYLRPDGKTQVTVEYDIVGKPKRIEAIVVSTQHAEGVADFDLYRDLRQFLIDPICGSLMDSQTKIHINPTGRFVEGGPAADSGLTGRKIIVDTYGGMGRHGGGAFSGKDPSKVDRSAAYAARWIAKHIVAAELADCCEVQLSYAIGVAEPVSIHLETFGTEKVPVDHLLRAIRETFDLRPAVIIEDLDLLQTSYRPLAAYGHMGREDLNPAWEQVSRIEQLYQRIRSEGAALSAF